MSYSLIINSKNRIAPTGSPNDATSYFDWAAFQESKYRVTWSIYRPPVAAAVLTPFQQLLVAKAPWGQYSAASWVSGTNTLTDLTGNGRHATTANLTTGTAAGKGVTASIPYIGGSTTSTILWPAGSIPTTFTICSITRYSGATKARLLTSSNKNWLHGHFNTARGCAYYEGWITTDVNKGTATDWLNCCGSNTNPTPSNLLVDGTSYGTALPPGNSGNGTLCVNTYLGGGETSDFQFSQLLIWNQALTPSEMATVSTALTNYLSTGVLQ